jgi:hypothetical protein
MNSAQGRGTFECCLQAIVVAALVVGAPHAQEQQAEAVRPPSVFDQILDTYVRDGWVRYRALKLDREKLDGYIDQLANASVARRTRDEQLAFWLNAYDAIVLQTVIDQYPIRGRSTEYPPDSIRQIPGAFDKKSHLVAGRTLTLDQMEQRVLTQFADPRVYFAISRGAVGGGRLRSEAFIPAELQEQLSSVAGECARRPQCIRFDHEANRLWANQIFSWREKDFIRAYAGSARPALSRRKPIERAVIAFVEPTLLYTEREILDKNTFQLAYQRFDWSLNDLAARGER